MILMEQDRKDYSFEISQEVEEKMKQADDLHSLISEDLVLDLKRVEVGNRFYCGIKRLLDMLLSALGLLVLLLPFGIMALIIYVDDPGDVMFTQYRVGKDGKRFKLYKFRTMKMDTPKYLSTMEMEDPDAYVTRVGRVFRKYSLDELPQLINVLKGDMSLVGPRPLISDEYEIHAMRTRFGVYALRPGVTGLAQINGRDTVSPAQKVRWDVRYLQELGFWTDLKILLATVPKIFGADGVAESSYPEKHEEEITVESE